ncbi:MAG: sec-independent protein translocase protein TatB, partial [Parvicella sp.]
MFTDVGFAEMAVIGIMALIVLGPERLPGAARAAGKWVGKARRMMGDMKRDIKAELDANELEGLKEIGKDIKEAGES